MVGTIQVRWCPCCRAWGKAKRIFIDPSQAFVGDNGADAVTFDYVRENFRCHSCTGDFTTTRITRCKPEHVWSARSVLAKLDAAKEARQSRRAIPLWWEHHPELSDFSGAPFAQPATN